jgi:hypothetical protein
MLDRRAIDEAVFIGQSRFEAERARFHEQYRLNVARPPIDWIDVITPFHRVALAAEARARLGSRTFGQREALAALNEAPNRLDLLVELTFHPLNTYVGVPTYEITLSGPKGVRVKAQDMSRYPRFGPRTGAKGPELPMANATPLLGDCQPMLGGTVLVQFSTNNIDPSGRYDVVVAESGKELARVALDLSKVR